MVDEVIRFFLIKALIKDKIEVEMKDDTEVSISIGAAYSKLPDNIEKRIEELIKKADDNLYAAKREGKNIIIIE